LGCVRCSVAHGLYFCPPHSIHVPEHSQLDARTDELLQHHLLRRAMYCHGGSHNSFEPCHSAWRPCATLSGMSVWCGVPHHMFVCRPCLPTLSITLLPLCTITLPGSGARLKLSSVTRSAQTSVTTRSWRGLSTAHTPRSMRYVCMLKEAPFELFLLMLLRCLCIPDAVAMRMYSFLWPHSCRCGISAV
jgi:hypothetical protein